MPFSSQANDNFIKLFSYKNFRLDFIASVEITFVKLGTGVQWQ